MRQFLNVAAFFAVAAVLGRAVQAQSFNLDQTNLNFSANAGTSPDPQQVTLFNLTANPLGIGLSVSGGFLSASISPDPVPGNGQATITVTVNSSTLPPNNNGYNGTVTVTDGNGTTIGISVSLSVSGVSISAPSSVSANVLIGQQTQISVHVSGGPATVLINSSVSFLSPDSQVDAPGNFSVTV